MSELIIQRPWLVVMTAALLLIVLEELLGHPASSRFGGRRISDNFILYSVGIGFVGLIGAALPGLEATAGSALLPGFGLTAWLGLPPWATFITLFLLESLVNYWVHRWNHAVPLLWRLHRVHHSDPTQDVSSAVRNHPLELIPTYLGQFAAIALVGATPGQAIAVGLVNLCWSLFTHADLGKSALHYPTALQFLVSPAYHRIHHSAAATQTDSNFGNMLAVWDHVFGTARNPAREAVGMIGLGPDYAASLSLLGQLGLPFRTVGTQAALKAALVRPPADRLTHPYPEATLERVTPGGL